MAHEISLRKNGFAEMAFTGARDAIWHGLGQSLEEGAPLETWRTAAGMDWQVSESPVQYVVGGEINEFPNRRVLFRSDTNEALGVVGNGFKVVQPDEVLEFFRDLVTNHGMKLSTAGTLFGGKRFWALAETGREGQVTEGDYVKGHLLLTTAVDGSMATTAKFVSTRVVCNNTLTIAMSEKGQSDRVRVTHRASFDPNRVKLDLGIIDKKWFNFMNDMKKLASTKMSEKQTLTFYKELLIDKNRDAVKQERVVEKHLTRLMALAAGGSGSDMSKGTAWGALCGLTEYFTHGTGKRQHSQQFWDSYHGLFEKKKMQAADLLMKMVA